MGTGPRKPEAVEYKVFLQGGRMQRVHLINMPFGTLELPSLALTQLSSRLMGCFPTEVSTRISYLNHDFGDFFGVRLYQEIAYSADHFHSGIGEWFFRRSAFPDAPDNCQEYFARYYHEPDFATTQLRQAILEKRGDVGNFLDSLIDQHEIDQADLVGFTSMFAQNLASIAMARRLKARNPDLTIVMGGANCEAPMGEEIARHVDVIDYIFSGPALVSFPKFVQCTLEGRTAERSHIPGVLASRSNVALEPQLSVFSTGSPRDKLGEDLEIDAAIPLDYDDFLDEFEQMFSSAGLEPALLFETSRGCWWGQRAHCTFCGLNGQSINYREMKPDVALKYLQKLLGYAPRCLKFMGVDNIMPKNYVQDVWPHLENPQGALLFYEVKADLNSEELAVMSRAGVKKIQPGIEALATSSLKLMKKGTSGCRNVRLLMDCRLNDVSPVWNILVGFPGETAAVFDKYDQEIPKLAHIPPPVGIFPVRFDRYSPYFNKPEEYGLRLRPFDFYEMVYPYNADSIARIAYYFTDDSLNEYQRAMVESFAGLKTKVEAWRDKWVGTMKEPPMLYAQRDDGGTVVVDSRFGQPTCLMLLPEADWLLDHLSQPRALDDALRAFFAAFGRDGEDTVGFLRERQWLFEDHNRVMSLVLEREPPRMTTWTS